MKRIKKILMLGLLIFSIVFLQSNVAIVNSMTIIQTSASETILLNEKKSLNISAGQVKTFYYTPDTIQYYVIETMGDADTKLSVTNLTTGALVNDNGGVGLNARITFKAEQSLQLKIEVKLANSSIRGTTTLQVRKERFSMFGYEDSDGNSTIPDLTTPYNEFHDMFDSYKYENTSSNHALSEDERGLLRLNSELAFFTGHGYKNSETEKGFGVAFKTGGITIDSVPNMDRAKIVMWSACYSANPTNSWNISIAEKSVAMGAKTAVGFTNSVGFSSSKTFTNRFFTKLASGSTVIEAAKHGANGLVWPWDTAKQYVVFGNQSTTVTDVTPPNIGTFSLPLTTVNDLLLRDELDGYFKTELDTNEFRYFKMVNGILTNEYIDIIINDSNQIISVDDHRSTHTLILEMNEHYKDKKIPFSVTYEGKTYNDIDNIDTRIVYYNMNGRLTPIELNYVTYINANYEVFSEAYCTNLHNGLLIDYSTINSA